MKKPPKPEDKHTLEYLNFFVQKERPEEYYGDPLRFYTKTEISGYAQSKSLMRTQGKITQRALEMIDVTPPASILDLGIGCGFSTTFCHLRGYRTVGVDLARDFLQFYHIPELNPLEADARYLPFAPDSFDGVISIARVS